MAEPRIRIAGPLAEQQLGHKAYRVEVLAKITYEMIAPSVADAERHARRLARGVVLNDEIVSIEAKPIDPLAQLREANLRGWLEGEALALMTQDQRERTGAGEYVEPEILHAVRAELYKGFAMKRWEPIRWQDVFHPVNCPLLVNVTADRIKAAVDVGSECFPSVDAHEAPTLTALEQRHALPILEQCYAIESHPWLMRQEARVTALLVQHTAKCRACGSSIVRRSMRVLIPWAGRTLSREFAL
jgi:hypothetical protein